MSAHALTATAQALHSTLEAAHLHIRLAAQQFEHESNATVDDDVSGGSDTVNDLRDPAVVAADVVAHIVSPSAFSVASNYMKTA